MSFPRYPKYKDSGVKWLGEVPEHWNVLRLKPILYEVDRRIGDQDALLLGLSKTAGLLPRADIGQNASESDDYSKYKECRVGDLVMNKMQAWNGVFGLSTHTGIVSPDYAVFRFRDQLFATFLTHVFGTDMAAGEFFCRCRGMGTAFLRINTGDFLDTKIALPPAEEVPCITAFLDRETAKIDALIAEQQRLIELLQEKRQAVISHAVTKGLNPDSPMKDSGIDWLGEVPEHWEVSRVKSVSSFTTSGPRGWSERVGEDGSLFVQSGDLNDSMEVDFANCKRVQVGEHAEAEAARTRLHDGDVVVCVTGAKTGNVAVCTSVPEVSYVNQHVCLIRPTAKVLPLFLGMVLKSGYGETYFSLAQYGLKQGLSLEDVREAPVIRPPLEEQRAITKTLVGLGTKSTSLVAEAEQAITLLQERRSALISAAVTGQIDVRGLAGSEAA